MDASTVIITVTGVPENLEQLNERPDPDHSRAKDTWAAAMVSASILLELGRRGISIPVDLFASIIAENVGPEVKMAQAEIARLRSRVTLVAEDVEGLTTKDLEAWLEANGWEKQRGSAIAVDGDRFRHWAKRIKHMWPEIVSVFESSPSRWAECINSLGRAYARPPLDILDEIRGAS